MTKPDEGPRSSGRAEIITRFKRHWLAALFFLVPLALYVLGPALVSIKEPYQHLLLTLTAVMGIHLLDRLFLVRDTRTALDGLISGVRLDISEQTKSLVQSTKSIEAMDQRGIVRIYASRTDAGDDMREDLATSSNTEIRLLGISLNDFVQSTDSSFAQTWATIRGYVMGHTAIDNTNRGLSIKVLIIDPRCFGAKLRSAAESPSGSAKRLSMEVEATARDLYDLQETASAKEGVTRVKLECRLYRLPPILFLCWTDSACYVQQYHFWTQRESSTPIPVLKFRRLATATREYAYHQQMAHHFDWIWLHASVPVTDYLTAYDSGTDEGMQQCAVVNVYVEPDKAGNRIVHLVRQAKERVTIQGISLHSFFVTGPLFEALTSLIDEGRVDVEVLILDPDSEQAKYRSYRERLLISGELTFNEYLGRGLHEKSNLYRDTNETLERIRYMVQDAKQKKPADWAPRMRVGLYRSAPACFALRVDGRVLVEQYHYGKVFRQQKRAILGKDMPVFEYCEAPHSLYQSDSNPLRSPFGLLVNHLEHATSQSTPVNLQVAE